MRIRVEAGLSSIAVVNIRIDNYDALKLILSYRIGCRQCHVVEQTKSARTLAISMVPGRAHKGKYSTKIP